jgi:hypothetical protein
LIALLLVLIPLAGSAAPVGSFVDDWEGVSADQATWADHYRKTARVRLGREQRLPNGIAWRLHTDVGSNLALPRITWMPNPRSTRTANDLLDMVHGGAMLFADRERLFLEAENDQRRRDGWRLMEYDHPIGQTDVDLTYATPTLMSVVDLGVVFTDWRRITTRIIRGLTFDLRTGEMFRIEACAGSLHPYGAKGGNYRFQFGRLLQLCDTETYLAFVRLLAAKSAQIAERAAASEDRFADCSEKDRSVVAPLQEIVLYLTFEGLAVLNTEYDPVSRRDTCSLERNPYNPIILPYRELEPFMIPGAWRDELLKLK